jgi:catechol 2,3-dioxygenase-like lactoylglutathione lyase family enzyme
MSQRLSLVTLVVADYDEAIAFFTRVLHFELCEDTPLGGDKRWVVVRPIGGVGSGLLLARADGPTQTARIGDQTGGRVFLFLETDDFERDHARMTAAGVRFVEAPRHEAYGVVAVFEDLYGNRWDLIQRSLTDDHKVQR